MITRLSWDTYYDGQYIKSSRLNTANSDNYFVSNCFFKESTSRIIFIYSSNDNTKLLLEYSTFSKMRVNATGACLYFTNSGQCVISQVCAFECSCINASGHFSSVQVSPIENHKNFVIESSFLCCGEESLGWSVLRILNGTILCDSNNVTSALAYRTCIIYLRSLQSENYVKFSDGINCSSSDAFGVSFYIGNFVVSYCNFESCSAKEAFFCTEKTSNATFKKCKVFEIKSYSLFWKGSASSMQVIDCLLVNSPGINNIGPIENMSGELIVAKKFLSTAFCEAYEPLNLIVHIVNCSPKECYQNINYSIYVVMMML